MKRFAILALVAGALTFGAGGAQAQDDGGTVTIVHAATYDFPGDPFPVTVCLDGETVDGDFQVGEQLGPISLPAGAYEAGVIVGADADCTGEYDFGGALTLTVGAGDNWLLVAAWNTGGPGLLLFDESQTPCVAPGEALATAVHAATAGTVDLWAGPAGGQLAPLVPEFLEGNIAGPIRVPAGSYDIAVYPTGSDPAGDAAAVEIDGLEVVEGTNTLFYVVGGNDGGIGAFVFVDDAVPCDVPDDTAPPTDDTVPAPGPTVPAPGPGTPAAAAPIAGQPTFTG